MFKSLFVVLVAFVVGCATTSASKLETVDDLTQLRLLMAAPPSSKTWSTCVTMRPVPQTRSMKHVCTGESGDLGLNYELDTTFGPAYLAVGYKSAVLVYVEGEVVGRLGKVITRTGPDAPNVETPPTWFDQVMYQNWVAILKSDQNLSLTSPITVRQ